MSGAVEDRVTGGERTGVRSLRPSTLATLGCDVS